MLFRSVGLHGRDSLYLYMETVELCRDFRREDLHGKIHHGLESRCDGERRADVRGIEINDMSYNEYEGAKYFLGHPHCV